MQVLILDDLFLSPLSDLERRDLLEIIEDRHGQAPTVITIQCPTKEWHQLIGEPTIADAICDRLLHHCYKMELHGESIRKTKKCKGRLARRRCLRLREKTPASLRSDDPGRNHRTRWPE